MVRNSLLINKSAAARLLQIATRVVKEVREFAFVVWVWVQGKRPTFMSKAAFKQEFVDFRRRAAQTLRILNTTNSVFGLTYHVQGSTGEVYQVERQKVGFACTCEDFHRMSEVLGDTTPRACKHIYAVLGTLGYSTLGEYLWDRRRPSVRNGATYVMGRCID